MFMPPFLQMRKLSFRKLFKFSSTIQKQALNHGPPLLGSKVQALITMSFSKCQALRDKHKAGALSTSFFTAPAVPSTRNGAE